MEGRDQEEEGPAVLGRDLTAMRLGLSHRVLYVVWSTTKSEAEVSCLNQ